MTVPSCAGWRAIERERTGAAMAGPYGMYVAWLMVAAHVWGVPIPETNEEAVWPMRGAVMPPLPKSVAKVDVTLPGFDTMKAVAVDRAVD